MQWFSQTPSQTRRRTGDTCIMQQSWATRASELRGWVGSVLYCRLRSRGLVVGEHVLVRLEGGDTFCTVDYSPLTPFEHKMEIRNTARRLLPARAAPERGPRELPPPPEPPSRIPRFFPSLVNSSPPQAPLQLQLQVSSSFINSSFLPSSCALACCASSFSSLPSFNSSTAIQFQNRALLKQAQAAAAAVARPRRSGLARPAAASFPPLPFPVLLVTQS